MTSSKRRWYRSVAEEEGTIGGLFSKEEKQKVRDAVERYILEQGWSKDEGIHILRGTRKTGVIEFGGRGRPGPWEIIAGYAGMGYRPIRNVFMCAQRTILSDNCKRGAWSADELKIVKEYVEEHGPRWVELGVLLNRNPEAVFNRWNFYGKSKRTSAHKFTKEQDNMLAAAIAEVTGCVIPSSNIEWEEVAEVMGDSIPFPMLRKRWGYILRKFQVDMVANEGELPIDNSVLDREIVRRVMIAIKNCPIPLHERLLCSQWAELFPFSPIELTKKRWNALLSSLDEEDCNWRDKARKLYRDLECKAWAKKDSILIRAALRQLGIDEESTIPYISLSQRVSDLVQHAEKLDVQEHLVNAERNPKRRLAKENAPCENELVVRESPLKGEDFEKATKHRKRGRPTNKSLSRVKIKDPTPPIEDANQVDKNRRRKKRKESPSEDPNPPIEDANQVDKTRRRKKRKESPSEDPTPPIEDANQVDKTRRRKKRKESPSENAISDFLFGEE